MALLHIKCLPGKHGDLSSIPSHSLKPGTVPLSVIQELPQEEKQTAESPATLRPASLGYPGQTGDLVSNKVGGKDGSQRLSLDLHTCTVPSVGLHSPMWTDTHGHAHHIHLHSQKITIQIADREHFRCSWSHLYVCTPKTNTVLNGIIISMWILIVLLYTYSF